MQTNTETKAALILTTVFFCMSEGIAILGNINIANIYGFHVGLGFPMALNCIFLFMLVKSSIMKNHKYSLLNFYKNAMLSGLYTTIIYVPIIEILMAYLIPENAHYSNAPYFYNMTEHQYGMFFAIPAMSLGIITLASFFIATISWPIGRAINSLAVKTSNKSLKDAP